MNIDGFLVTNSDYMKKEDCPQPILCTIAGATVEKLGDDDKLVIHFSDHNKGLVANKVNLTLMAQIFASTDTDEWIGKKIVLYTDASVMMSGKVVGGVRVRAAKNQPAPVAPAAPAAPAADFDDDVPF